jgi:hypothetical protein
VVFVFSFQIGAECGYKECSYLVFKSGRDVIIVVFVCSFQIGTGCGRKWCSYLVFKSERNVDISSVRI